MRSFYIGCMKIMIHYDAHLELRRLAGAQGAFELESYRRRRVVVGREIRGAAEVEVGAVFLRVDVSVPCHPAVKCTDEWRRGDLMSASAVSKSPRS